MIRLFNVLNRANYCIRHSQMSTNGVKDYRNNNQRDGQRRRLNDQIWLLLGRPGAFHFQGC